MGNIIRPYEPRLHFQKATNVYNLEKNMGRDLLLEELLLKKFQTFHLTLYLANKKHPTLYSNYHRALKLCWLSQ